MRLVENAAGHILSLDRARPRALTSRVGFRG